MSFKCHLHSLLVLPSLLVRVTLVLPLAVMSYFSLHLCCLLVLFICSSTVKIPCSKVGFPFLVLLGWVKIFQPEETIWTASEDAKCGSELAV